LKKRSISTNLETRITRISHCHALIARNRDRGTNRCVNPSNVSRLFMYIIDRIVADRLLQILTHREWSSMDMNLHLFVIHM